MMTFIILLVFLILVFFAVFASTFTLIKDSKKMLREESSLIFEEYDKKFLNIKDDLIDIKGMYEENRKGVSSSILIIRREVDIIKSEVDIIKSEIHNLKKKL